MLIVSPLLTAISIFEYSFFASLLWIGDGWFKIRQLCLCVESPLLFQVEFSLAGYELVSRALSSGCLAEDVAGDRCQDRRWSGQATRRSTSIPILLRRWNLRQCFRIKLRPITKNMGRCIEWIADLRPRTCLICVEMLVARPDYLIVDSVGFRTSIRINQLGFLSVAPNLPLMVSLHIVEQSALCSYFGHL